MSPPKKDRKVQSLSGKTFPDDNGPPLEAKGFVPAIADALHRGFGGTHAAIKMVVALTGSNERAVKNWFSAKNGPNGENLIILMRHSDEVLEIVLLMAGRAELVNAKKLVDARHKLKEMLAIMDEIQRGP